MKLTKDTTYEQVRDNFDKPFSTPWGDDKVRCIVGNNLSERGYRVQFKGGYWTSNEGFVSNAEHRAKKWQEEFDQLSKVDKELFMAVIGDQIATLPLQNRKPPSRLVNVAKIRLIKAGKIEYDTCGRCGGSGHHSYCEAHGTTCFGCGGSGKKYPSSTKCLKAAK